MIRVASSVDTFVNRARWDYQSSTVCHDMPWVTTEGRTCDDIRDVLRLPREPSGDNKRTTRTGMYQWTTLYCAKIALVLDDRLESSRMDPF